MVDDILKYAKVAGWISIFLFFITMSVFVWSGLKLPNQLSSFVSQAQVNDQKATEIINDIDRIANNIDITLDNVNRPCGIKLQPCGTLADVNQTLHTVRGTFGQIEIAANHEDRNLTNLDSQENQLFNDSHKLFSTGNDSLFALTTTLNTFNNPEKGLPPLFTATTETMNDLDGTVKRVNNKLDDPKISSITNHMDNIFAHVDGMTADSQYKLHQMFHPDKVKLTFWGGADATMVYIHSHIMPPLF